MVNSPNFNKHATGYEIEEETPRVLSDSDFDYLASCGLWFAFQLFCLQTLPTTHSTQKLHRSFGLVQFSASLRG